MATVYVVTLGPKTLAVTQIIAPLVQACGHGLALGTYLQPLSVSQTAHQPQRYVNLAMTAAIVIRVS